MKETNIVKHLNFGLEARQMIYSGVDKLYKAVSSTLGASGKSVILEDDAGNPIITKDGVSVANSIILRDAVENMGATLLKDAARKTVDEAGDGTTTATVLAHAILTEAYEHDVKDVKYGIKTATDKVVKYLEKIAKPVSGGMLKHVATISANNDPELGEIISSAFEQVGDSGVVTMESSNDEKTYHKIISGASFDKGLTNLHFATDEDKSKCVLNNPVVLICENKISNIREIESVLEFVIKNNKELLIVAEAESQVTGALAMNKLKGNIKINVIDSPDFGFNRKQKLHDLALITGAKVISEDLGDDIDMIQPEHLGVCLKSTTDLHETIIEIDEVREELQAAIDSVKSQLKKETNQAKKLTQEKRLGFLSCKVGVIRVGANSEVELKEKIDRVEDAINATRAAIKEGVVPGGGIALLNAAYRIKPANEGEEILLKAIQKPWQVILDNADFSTEQMEARAGYGLDVKTGKSVNMIKAGIIDPLLVAKSALKNAVSVSTTILSTNCVINNLRIDESNR
jgi:chaperonin GroEL